ncbi:DUF885 domain-containing protein [soil metagenome]
MKKVLYVFFFAITAFSISCTPKKQEAETADSQDQKFANLEKIFLDAYWKQYPSLSILNGYGKYYETLIIPEAATFTGNIAFSKQWLDSLSVLNFDKLTDNNKISFKIIKNQLESDVWYQSVFKSQEWDASQYNLSGDCYYIINQPYAPLDDRLKILSARLQKADQYYTAALHMLKVPTREHLELSIQQNEGGLSIFGKDLTDSINVSHLTTAEKDTLHQQVIKTVTAIHSFVDSLKLILADKNFKFRDFRIGKEMFTEKFKYDLATDFTPEELYAKAVADKKFYYGQMTHLADSLWTSYYPGNAKPKDTLAMVQSIIDKISMNHSTPEKFFSTLTTQVYDLKKFIVSKDLFDFDTTYAIKVRIMPAYARGFSIASAEFTPAYQTSGETYYNIDDLTLFPKEKAEGVLKEYNTYSSQLLSIHEAIPGHCVQGIYNNKKSPDVVRSVFQNGAMIEGWAVYTESMMLDNGWGNFSPEITMVHDKLKLRELANVIIDYDIQCLNKPKEDIMHLLVDECFQTKAQADEKYHRATVSQVQLCSYYAGSSAIQALRDDYKKKLGEKYNLKAFHEKFLSYGSSPVKYIREEMLK